MRISFFAYLCIYVKCLFLYVYVSDEGVKEFDLKTHFNSVNRD